MKFVIDRNKWRNGDFGETRRGKGITYLKHRNGSMCCLGQCINQLEPEVNLLNVGSPRRLKVHIPLFNKPNHMEDGFVNTKLSSFAMMINDDPNTPSEEKEKELMQLFNENELEIEFIN